MDTWHKIGSYYYIYRYINLVPTVNTLMENAYMVMTFRSSSNKIVQSEIVLLYPDPENSQKGAILHRCGACHRASDAKVRMSNSRKAVLGRCQCVYVFFLPFFLPGLPFIYTCRRSSLLSVGTLKVIFIPSL